MVQFTNKPVYTPPSKIDSGLFTTGKEYMYADTLEEYFGLYHRYPNNAIYSEAQFYPERSRPLVDYVDQSSSIPLLDKTGADIGTTSNNNSVYFRITERRFNNHYKPPYHYPEPNSQMYDVGYMDRYFAQRINDNNNIIEITPDEFDRRNSQNKPGIDDGLYRFVKIKWTIDGPLKEVRKTNARVIANAEFIDRFNGLNQYLTDLDEFHKNRHKILTSNISPEIETNLYTAGGKYMLTNGEEYVGAYHIHPDKGPMVGPEHSSEPHAYLKPIQDTDQKSSY